ncbi:hypothetical protein HDV06_005423 [Boothiomyces sp. JEL0866]|nr:hypothetical protein HDV06_005423 [Boothiomyces sp. JEL0866]
MRDKVEALPETIRELFKCFICYDSLDSPLLLPCCSKIGCKTCIDKWINGKNKCPHCRSFVQSKQLVPFRFMNDLVSQLSGSLEKENKTAAQDYCDTHNELMIYFCRDCSDGLCSDCVAFETTHREHHLERIQSLYHESLKNLNDQMSVLESRSAQYSEIIEFTQTAVQSIAKSGQDTINEQRRIFKESEKRITLKVKELSAPFKVCERRIKSESQKLENTIRTLESKITNASPIHIIKNSDKIVSLINRHPTLTYQPQIPNLDINIETEHIPPFEHREFEICDYQSLHYCFSPTFSISGLDWRVNFRIDGGILTAFVELLTQRDLDAEYQFFIEMKYGDPAVVAVSNQVAYVFDKQSRYTYIEIGEVADVDKMFQNSSSVTIQFNVRPTSWKQKFLDLEYLMKSCSSLPLESSEPDHQFKDIAKPKTCIQKYHLSSPRMLRNQTREDEIQSPNALMDNCYSSNEEVPSTGALYDDTVSDPFDQQALAFSNSLIRPLFLSSRSDQSSEGQHQNIGESFNSPVHQGGYLDDLYSSIRDEEERLNFGDFEDDLSENSNDSEYIDQEQSTTYLDNVLDTLDSLQDGNTDNHAILERLKTNVIEILARYTSSFNIGIDDANDDETYSNNSMDLTEL